MDRWLGGWMGVEGSKSQFKDCLQQSKRNILQQVERALGDEYWLDKK